MDKTALGDRMKGYEARETERRLMPLLPVLARIDGRAFSAFTRDLERPYDTRMMTSMLETTKFLVEETGALVGYTQSDEISLLMHSTDEKSQLFFDGRVLKLTSVLASLATVEFNRQIAIHLPSHTERRPVFDCRVWNVPNEQEATNAFLWRERDATKNSISMAARAYFPAEQLFGKTGNEMQAMLLQRDVNWNDYPSSFRRGVFVRRQRRSFRLSAEQRAELPENHKAHGDPNFEYERWVIESEQVPPFGKVVNKADFLFRGAAPETESLEP